MHLQLRALSGVVKEALLFGPSYYLHPHEATHGSEKDIRRAAEILLAGGILAVKGLGGYRLACDARNATAVTALRQRKYRKEKPFAVMAQNAGVARTLVDLSPESESLLTSSARPIVLAPAKVTLPDVAPENHELGVMLPYHHYSIYYSPRALPKFWS